MRRFAILLKPLYFNFRRGEKKPFRITLVNLSRTPWPNTSVGPNKKPSTGSMPLVLSEESTPNFRIQYTKNDLAQPLYRTILGRTPSHAKLFHPVVVTIFPEAKHPTPAGKYDLLLQFGKGRWGTPIKHKSTIKVRIKLKPALTRWDDIKLWFRLTFLKPGKVKEEYSNHAFEQLPAKNDRQAVIMAVWSRPEFLKTTTMSLEKQIGVKTVLYLWINDKNTLPIVRRHIKGIKLPVKVFVSPWNIGGFGRFYAARRIESEHKSVVFLDDDQIPSPSAIRTLLNEHRNGQVWGQFAHTFKNRQYYWDKNLNLEPGKKATYIGTGGMIISSEIFANKGLYKCPKRYWFIEDLWLSWFVKQSYKYKLYKSSAKIEMMKDQKDQYVRLIDHKNDFFRYLVKRGLLEL